MKPLTLPSEFARVATAAARTMHRNSVEHGFHDFNEDDGQFLTRALLLVNGEAAECYEAYRNGALMQPCDKAVSEPLCNLEEELADIAIRVFDMSVRLGVDIGRAMAIKHEYNLTRPYRHGGKKA